MSYGTDSFWDIYSFGLHPICGTVTVVIAAVVFLVGTQDSPERKHFWVGTILGGILLGLCAGEWGAEAVKLNYFDMGHLLDPVRWNEWLVRSSRSRMMFMVQAGLAVSIALGLLWWPIRPKQES